MILMSHQALYGVLAALLMLLAALSVKPAMAQAAADHDAVLAANTEFHRAFRGSDMPAMEAVWGETAPIAVEHPSSWREEGREAVLASWASLFALAAGHHLSCRGADLRSSLATVLCNEDLNPGHVRMMSIFHHEGEHWKIIYHGPAPDTVTS